MRFSKKFLLKSLFAGAALLFMSASAARADLVLEFTGSSAVGDNFQYSYNVFLTPGSELDAAGGGTQPPGPNPGNFLTYYAVNGLVSGSETLSATLGALFGSVTEQSTGITPPGISDFSKAGLLNITLHYTASQEVSNPLTGGNLLLGSFSFLSTNGPATTAATNYSGATQQNLPGSDQDEEIANNTATVVGPGTTAPPVPEPASFILALAGLPALALLRRRRKIA